MTVEEALAELREMFPTCKFRQITTYDAEPAEPYTSVMVFVDDEHDSPEQVFMGHSLDQAMTQVRNWKASHQP